MRNFSTLAEKYVKSIKRKEKLRKKLVCCLRAMFSKKTKKAPTNGFDTTDDR